MSRKSRGRVNGPYRAGNQFRVVLVPSDGARSDLFFATEAKARRFIADARLELEAQTATLVEGIELYAAAMAERQLKPITIKTARFRLRAILGSIDHDTPLGDITPRLAQTSYDAMKATHRPDTHRNSLAAAKAFFAWAVKSKYAPTNPFEAVEPTGTRSAGKPQLRVDEARRVLHTVLARAGTDPEALAVLVILLLGLRASECAAIEDRDIDDDGRLLWIPASKTKAGIRRLAMPAALGALLKARAKGGAVFPGAHRHWVLNAVRRICTAAGVPPISAHGLRGTHASLAVRGGATAEAVGTALGHADAGHTASGHYIQASTATEALTGAVINKLLNRCNDVANEPQDDSDES